LDGPDPSEVYIKSLVYGGTGCPRGSAAVSVADDRQSFTLIFDKFVASTGPGVPITESRRNCQLNVAMNYPAGWQYSVMTSVYRGYVQMENGVSGLHKSTYYFQGEEQQFSSQASFRGPVDKDYVIADDIAMQSWSPCGESRSLNINSQVRLMTQFQGTSGQMTQDSEDGKVKQILNFQWRRC